MLRYLVSFIFFTFVFSYVSAQDERTKAMSNLRPLTIGFSYGEHYSWRWLRDNPRYSLDNPNFTDTEFLALRDQYENPALVSSFSIRLDYILNEKFRVQTGVHISDVGENVQTNNIGNANFQNYYQSVSSQDGRRENRYNSLEVPILLEMKLAPQKRYNLSKKRTNLPAFPRKLTGIIGMGFGKTTGFNSPYEYYSYNKSANFLVRLYAGLGYVQALSEQLEFNIRALARYTYTPMHKFEPVNAYYYNFGGDVGVNYRLKKRKRIQPSMSLQKCFKCGDPVFEIKKFDWGVVHGVNLNFLHGPDKDADINAVQIYKQWYDSLSLFSIIDSGDPKFYPIAGAHIGLHLEFCFLSNILGIMGNILYSEKGFNLTNEHQVATDGGFEKFVSETRVRMQYADIPISLRCKPFPNFYIFSGLSVSALLSNRVNSMTHFYYDTPKLNNSDFNKREVDFTAYFESVPKIMVLNYHFGVGYIFNDKLDAQFRFQRSTSFVEQRRYEFLTGMFSLIYFIGERDNW